MQTAQSEVARPVPSAAADPAWATTPGRFGITTTSRSGSGRTPGASIGLLVKDPSSESAAPVHLDVSFQEYWAAPGTVRAAPAATRSIGDPPLFPRQDVIEETVADRAAAARRIRPRPSATRRVRGDPRPPNAWLSGTVAGERGMTSAPTGDERGERMTGNEPRASEGTAAMTADGGSQSDGRW